VGFCFLHGCVPDTTEPSNSSEFRHAGFFFLQAFRGWAFQPDCRRCSTTTWSLVETSPEPNRAKTKDHKVPTKSRPREAPKDPPWEGGKQRGGKKRRRIIGVFWTFGVGYQPRNEIRLPKGGGGALSGFSQRPNPPRYFPSPGATGPRLKPRPGSGPP